MTKWVYTFGDGAAEGRAGDRNLLGGKGANLAEMCSLGLPVPPGFTITTEVCNWLLRQWPRLSRTSSKAEVEAALGHIAGIDRPQLRRSREAAAGFGALGRARLDAGHDGYRAQSRPQRRDRRGAGRRFRRCALCL